MFIVEQVFDVFVDACVRNSAGQLLFLSVYGRDTATKELMSRIQIGSKGDDGLTSLNLIGQDVHSGQSYTVHIGDPARLDKLTGRLSRNLFGNNLTQLWIFDPIVQKPSKGAKEAWIIERVKPYARFGDKREETMLLVHTRIWQAICMLAYIPLLPHWQKTVLSDIAADCIEDMDLTPNPLISKPIGDLMAFHVRLDDDFPERVSKLIRGGGLTLEPPVGLPLH